MFNSKYREMPGSRQLGETERVEEAKEWPPIVESRALELGACRSGVGMEKNAWREAIERI